MNVLARLIQGLRAWGYGGVEDRILLGVVEVGLGAVRGTWAVYLGARV